MKLNTSWKIRSDLIQKLLTLTASFASIGGLLVLFLPPMSELPWWAILLIIISVLGFILLIALEFNNYRNHHIYPKNNTQEISDYMYEWIENGGRVAIWTRDMSWADEPRTKQLLMEKAKKKELILCLPSATTFATKLLEVGAEVCSYGSELLESPASRFTIIFFGRDGSRVAVGRAQNATHVIDEFSAGEHPAFHLAADLVTLTRAMNKKNKIDD